MWIARDKDKLLYFFSKKPEKDAVCWYNAEFGDMGHTEIDCTLFPEIKWEDAEPTEVELVIKRKEV